MLQLLMNRRSIRKFENRPVEAEKIRDLVKAALVAPSSKNSQPWEFIVVNEPSLLAELSRSRETGAAFLKHAPLAIVVLADPSKSNVWVEDTAIAATLIQLEAETLGLGSCWVQVRNRYCDGIMTTESFIRELLGIPENRHVASMIALGYPAEVKRTRTEADLPKGGVFVNRYGAAD